MEQKEDESLVEVRKQADARKGGYSWQDVHLHISGLGEECVRIVVPRGRRNDVLKLAHSSLLGGHLSIRKTRDLINRSFTWPGMVKGIKEWCFSCQACQKAQKAAGGKAPLKPLPVITEPFSGVAFDLVGPLPRTKPDHKYILTSMCLASKYPEAIPLKKVDAPTVTEAMLEIFSRIGVPSEILTDQGTVFVGKLTSQLCGRLGVGQIKTSPYHPHSGTLAWDSQIHAQVM